MANLFWFYGDFIVINGTVYDDSWYCLWWLTEIFGIESKPMGIQSRFVCNKNDGDVMVVSLGYQRAIKWQAWVGHGLYRCNLQLTTLRGTIKKMMIRWNRFGKRGCFLWKRYLSNWCCLPKLQKLCLQIHDWYVTIINIHARSCVTFSVG